MMRIHQPKATLISLLTTGDKILIAGIAAISVFSMLLMSAFSTPGSFVVIDAAGNQHYRYRLAENRTITCEGPVGKSVIQIQDGAVSVQTSDCPQKICVKSGAIQKCGQLIVCVPNKIIIKIEGEDNRRTLDVITR
ncbi:NusG domain II-containing protein [candidate division KSB1 bacterium]|nr:NusG domain II-containing protein [candidate division KSB1 bacterium]